MKSRALRFILRFIHWTVVGILCVLILIIGRSSIDVPVYIPGINAGAALSYGMAIPNAPAQSAPTERENRKALDAAGKVHGIAGLAHQVSNEANSLSGISKLGARPRG